MGARNDESIQLEQARSLSMVPLVFGVSISAAAILWAIAFGAATTCTNNGGRSCGRVDVTCYVAIGAVIVVGLLALFGPWPHRRPVLTYIAVIVLIGLLAFALMATWSAELPRGRWTMVRLRAL